MKKYLIISVLLSISKISLCQVFGNETNINYNHFTLNPGASISAFKTSDPININLLHQTYTGLLDDIKVLYLDAKYDLQSNNVIGIKVFNKQKTRELTSVKLHLFYVTDVEIRENIHWSTGVDFGFANAYVGPTRSSAGGSDWALDGAISTALTAYSFYFGAAMHQITNPTLMTINKLMTLHRYYELVAIKKTKINDLWEMKNGVKGLLSPDFNTYGIDNQVIYNEQLSLLLALSSVSTPTLSVFSNKTVSMGGGYRFDLENKHLFDLALTYQLTDRLDQSNTGLFMINLGYSVK